MSWARVLGELVVIVAGILIALAADAWWQGLADEEQEREYLKYVVEFNYNIVLDLKHWPMTRTVRYAAGLLSRSRMYSGGRIACEQTRGKQYKRALIPVSVRMRYMPVKCSSGEK